MDSRQLVQVEQKPLIDVSTPVTTGPDSNKGNSELQCQTVVFIDEIKDWMFILVSSEGNV